ncbi:MAG: hypothetical protein ACJ8R9_30355 [Steroidobacteraceae bacterium]
MREKCSQVRKRRQSTPPNPTIWIERMTWMDVRDAIDAFENEIKLNSSAGCRNHCACKPFAAHMLPLQLQGTIDRQ